METINVFENLINSQVCALLINDDFSKSLEKYAVIIPCFINDEDLMCSYDKETGEKIRPKWLQKLYSMEQNKKTILLIKDLNEIDNQKQIRFKEIIKYKSINGIKLPKNSIVIASHSNSDKQIIEPLLCELIRVN